ncbi:MAG: 5'-deoxynucleotidase [Firmicutes bacterium]|nr:5'-deoxynucleotidase [Bacillota bacterium]
MSHSFFAYIARLKHIGRWSLMRCSVPENVAEHSLQTSMIAQALALIGNRYFGGTLNADRIASIALYHDASEVITGDLPTPIKYYNPEIKHSYGEIENIANEKLLSMLPKELQADYRALLFPENDYEKVLVKAADKICAYFKCLEEQKSGNGEFRMAAENTLQQIEQFYYLPEVKFFMENFSEGFKLTLDELK